MPYLALDGLTIPVRPGDTEDQLEIGTRSRMFSGTLMRTARAHKRQWGFQTTPMKREDYTALVGILLGRGDLWTYDADLYSEKGLGADAGSVTTLRPGAGADGAASPLDAKFTGSGKGAIAVDDDTTNISSVRDVESTSGWTVSGATVAASTTHKYVGNGSVLISFTASGQWAKVTISTTASASTAYALSAYFKFASGNPATDPITMEFLDNGVVVGGSGIPTDTVVGNWTRAYYATTTDATPGAHTIEIRVKSTVAATFDVAIDAIQLEQKGFSTSFRSEATARGTGALKYTSALLAKATQGWTASFWTPAQSSASASSPGGVLDVTNAAASLTANRFEVRIDPAIPNLAVFLYGADGTSATLTTAVVLNVWRMWTIVVRTNAPTGLFGLEIYRDGVRVNQSSPAAAAIPDVTAFAKIAVGMRMNGATRLNAQLDDLRLLPYPASPNQIAGWFNAGISLPGPPRTRMTGTAIHESSLTVEGEVVGEQAVEVAFSGTHVPEAKQVDFALHEV